MRASVFIYRGYKELLLDVSDSGTNDYRLISFQLRKACVTCNAVNHLTSRIKFVHGRAKFHFRTEISRSFKQTYAVTSYFTLQEVDLKYETEKKRARGVRRRILSWS